MHLESFILTYTVPNDKQQLLKYDTPTHKNYIRKKIKKFIKRF